jgi:Diaminopimelate decarboxylase
MKEKELDDIIKEYKTPFYLFDTDLLAKQISKIRSVLSSKVKLCYAMKANPFLVNDLAHLVDYFEVCSPGEFHICESASLPMGKIIMSGVYKKQDDIAYALQIYNNQITYTIESYSQWQLLIQYSSQHQLKLQALLRLTSGNQFGMDESLIRQLIENRDHYPFISIEGIQYYSGTQKKSPNKHEHELSMLDHFCMDLKEQYGFDVNKLEYGPGLPIYYFEEENDEEDLMLDSLAHLIDKLQFGGKLTLELGRFIAANCGYYVTSVVDVKKNKGESFCIVDGGIHQLNYFGQMMAMKKPPIWHRNKGDGEAKDWTVCGSLCSANDILVRQYPFDNLQLGDKLVFQKAGAYSVTEGISLFLSRDLPQVLIYSTENDIRVARKAYQTYALNFNHDMKGDH